MWLIKAEAHRRDSLMFKLPTMVSKYDNNNHNRGDRGL